MRQSQGQFQGFRQYAATQDRIRGGSPDRPFDEMFDAEQELRPPYARLRHSLQELTDAELHGRV